MSRIDGAVEAPSTSPASESLRRRTYRLAFPLVAAVLTALWLVGGVFGYPHAVDRFGMPALAIVFGGAAFAIHRWPHRLRSIETALLGSTIAFFLLAALWALATRTLAQEMLILNAYLPLVYGAAFLMLGPREGTNVSVLVFGTFASIVALALTIGEVDGYLALPVFFGSGLAIALLTLVTTSASASARHQAREEAGKATDALTGVLNRAGGRSAMDRIRGPFALLWFDVESLARINDLHGHLQGDDVLVAVARAIERDLRPRDLLIRWGGDEFVVAAIDADVDGARAMAARVASNLETLGRRRGFDVRLSIGIAEAGPGRPWTDALETAALDQWSKRSVPVPT